MYITQVLKQGININTMCPNKTLEFRNTQSHLLQVYLGAWVKIGIVIENHVCQIVGHCYYSFQAYILFNARYLFHLKQLPNVDHLTLTLESHPLKVLIMMTIVVHGIC